MKRPELQKSAIVAKLEDELRRRDERIADLRKELIEAAQLVDDMKEQVESCSATIDGWIEAFAMSQDEDGLWRWSSNTSDHWQYFEELQDEHRAVVRKWNQLVGRYNTKVAGRPLGRPLEASDAQVADVLARRKRGESLRAIATDTSLGLKTVRSITDKAQRKDKATVRRGEMRKLELDKIRSAEYRARKKLREGLPKRITSVRKRGDELILAAKGLGRGLV